MIILIFLIILLSFLNFNCSRSSCCIITVPPITFTSERTALENQIIGDYKRIRNDIWLKASAQAIEGMELKEESSKEVPFSQKLLSAYKTQEYNKNEIELLKSKGIIGENNEGFIEYLTNAELEKNPKEKERILKIISEENDARLIFMLEVIKKNKNLTIEDLPAVKKSFAKFYIEQLKEGEYYQTDEGRWLKK